MEERGRNKGGERGGFGKLDNLGQGSRVKSGEKRGRRGRGLEKGVGKSGFPKIQGLREGRGRKNSNWVEKDGMGWTNMEGKKRTQAENIREAEKFRNGLSITMEGTK